MCQAELGGAGPDALRARLGPRLSIAECVEGLQDICRIYRCASHDSMRIKKGWPLDRLGNCIQVATDMVDSVLNQLHVRAVLLLIIYREEQALRSILVQRLHYGLSQEECGVVLAAFSGRPGVSGAVVGPKDLLHRVLDASSA